jgi:hypothetical protein
VFGDFLSQFGLNFSLQDQNAQGGLFGSDVPQTQQQSPLGAPAASGGAPAGIGTPNIASAAAPGAISGPSASPNPTAVGGQSPTAPSPFASPLAPGGGAGISDQYNSAPAAGVGSQFSGKAL